MALWTFTCSCHNRHREQGRIEVELHLAPWDDPVAALAAMRTVHPSSEIDHDGGHVWWKCSPKCLYESRLTRHVMQEKWERARQLARDRTGLSDPAGAEIWKAWDVLYPVGSES